MNFMEKVEKEFYHMPAIEDIGLVDMLAMEKFIKSKIREAVMEYRRLASIEDDDTVGLAEFGITEGK